MKTCKKSWLSALAGLGLFLSLPALANTPGVMLRDDDLRSAANATAAASGKVVKGAAVQILSQQGAWMQVRADGNTGWVRLLNVRKGTAMQTDVAGGVAGVLALGTTRSDPSRVVATAGVRGLDEEDLKAAKFDAKQVEKLNSLGVSREQAERFARQGKLVARQLDYLPAPRAQPGGGSGGGGSSDAGGGFNFMGGE